MTWTPEQEANLEVLWAKGVSTQEIADRLGKNKNGVIGKARRLNLGEHPNSKKRYDKNLIKQAQKMWKDRTLKIEDITAATGMPYSTLFRRFGKRGFRNGDAPDGVRGAASGASYSNTTQTDSNNA